MTLTDILFSSVNITLTLLAIVLIIYWVVTMATGLDFDLDIDVDVDVDVDVDMDVDLDTGLDVDSASGVGAENIEFSDIANTEINKEDILSKRRQPLKWWQIVLIYFNFVGLPFMFTFTCWIFIWWTITTLSTTFTHSIDNTFGFILMLGGLLPSLFITKIFTTPFKGFFKNLNQDGDAPIDITGRIGTCLSNIKDNKLGRATVVAENTPLDIMIKSLNGSPIPYNSSILIIKQSADKTYYYAQRYNN